MIIDDKNSEKDMISEYADERIKGKSFSTIREELTARGYQKEKINELIRSIDDAEIIYYRNKSDYNQAWFGIIIGCLLIAGGCVMSLFIPLYSFAGLVLIVSPIVGGSRMYFEGRKKYKITKKENKF